MPTFKQNLNVLKSGIQRRGTRDNAVDFSVDQRLPTRDHYERWAHYYKRQYPKRKQIPWADIEVLDQAVAAARDTPLGIVDTITREYITYWMPEIMLFVLAMDDDESDDGQTHVLIYKSLADRVRRGVLDVIRRVDCGKDEAANTLAAILEEKTEDRLSKLFVVFEDLLTDEERRVYKPAKFELLAQRTRELSYRSTKSRPESIPEARILNSSLAWELSDSRIQQGTAHIQPKVPSPRKRKYSEMRSSPGPDPADNGQVWDSPKFEFKRQRFDFTFRSTVQLPRTDEYTTTFPHRGVGRSRQQYDTVDLTGNGDDEDDGSGHNMSLQDGFPDSSELKIPGSLSSQPKDGQCMLM